MSISFPIDCSYSDINFDVHNNINHPVLAVHSNGEKLITISNSIGVIVTIYKDGTVEINQEGKHKEAANLFYEALSKVIRVQLSVNGEITDAIN